MRSLPLRHKTTCEKHDLVQSGKSSLTSWPDVKLIPQTNKQTLYRPHFPCFSHPQDFLQLGPLELKLLNVTGHRMPIYRLSERSAEEEKAESYQPTDWPVTHPMLKGATTPRPWARVPAPPRCRNISDTNYQHSEIKGNQKAAKWSNGSKYSKLKEHLKYNKPG